MISSTSPVVDVSEVLIPAGTPLLFDMDGTLVDNMVVHHRAWQEHLKELGLTLSMDEIKATIWGKNEDIYERIFPGRFTLHQMRELGEKKELRYVELYTPEIAFLPGLEDFLTAAKEVGCPMAIATAAPKVCVDFVSHALRLGRFFTTIIDADQVQRSKPFPDPYLAAARALGASLERCIVFEDAPVGVRSAEAAGMRSYVLLTTHQRHEFASFPKVLGYLADFSRVKIAN